ncbi:WhiB family transcriptional regulator [Pseudonocardia nigra]|uniref:WhiB family transcriptional regulator n=1 Tax=Pseudonocardia nigra TaxID=1921578 RepID=UPI0027E27AD0|nr:WhiB family transcriptional regulator [Pseudonocardia nigra]
MFFPASGDGPIHDVQVTVAKAVCGGCPVRAECLTWALEALPYGVAGGLTEQERRHERTRRRGRRREVPGRPVCGS